MIDNQDLCIGAPYSVTLNPDEKTGTPVPEKVLVRLFNRAANLYFEGEVTRDGDKAIATWEDTSKFISGIYGLEAYETTDGESPISQPIYREDKFVRAINASVTIGATKG